LDVDVRAGEEEEIYLGPIMNARLFDQNTASLCNRAQLRCWSLLY
jgi:hypothetical protein